MLTVVFAITTLICAGKWLKYKMGWIAILLYFGERGYKLPESEDIKKYSEKAIKKILHIKG